jgi:hypothetical protein
LLTIQGRQEEGVVVVYSVGGRGWLKEKGKVWVVTQSVLPVCCCHSEGKRKHSVQNFLMFDICSFFVCDVIGKNRSRSTCTFMHVEFDGSFVIHLPAIVSGVGL